MHYLDEGSGAPILLLHGEPTWAFLYRKLIPTLARGSALHRAGLLRASAAPTSRPTASGTRTTGTTTSIERLVRELDLRDLTVVVQDWGGPIGFRLCVSEPDRDRAPRRPQHRHRSAGSERRVAALPGVHAPRRHRHRRRAARAAVARPARGRRGDRGLRRAVSGTRGTRRDRACSRSSSRRARATLRTPRCSTCASGCARSTALRSSSSRTATRSSAARAAEAMAALLPNAELDPPLEGAGHFLQEDRGEQIAARIAAWLGTLDQPLTRGVRSGGGPRRLRELAQDVRDVPVDRVLRQDERRRDLAVAHPGRDETQDLGLARL